VFGLGITDKQEQRKFIDFASKLFKIYMDKDVELIEIIFLKTLKLNLSL